MIDSKSNLKRAQRTTYLLISASLLLWAVKPEWETYAGGWVVGLFGSLIMAWHLQYKTSKLASIVANTGNKPRFNLGFLTRASIGVLAFVVSNEVLHYNFYMTIAGLFVVHLLTIAFIRKSQTSVERGEKETWNT
jgi:ATP synthase protein I